ncbi:tryptophan synthase subunit alpha [Permianibacter sp. IMCC34836]|uniref:tryptophan synthase subunit alpha n=1 Tax=Permianibacter fluminis TaxID=2738515 RepID=UPI0015521719|nr:tryptophan synthase subunit alpha [Permianibacter fluminis]NQD38363.1 tryptophan synthase subunit alpha [Permianibacter fluminis]
MNRYQNLFARLRDRNEGALIPFLMLGDPNAEQSFERICAVVEAGADALELGIPYSDPVADGPTIVAAANRALAAGVTPPLALALVARVRAKYPSLPIGLLVYANLVYGAGVEHFFAEARTAGVDSLLIPDVPLRESALIREAGAKHGIENVFILPPNASAETQAEVARLSQGYVYLLSRAGVTGSETAAQMPLEHLIAGLTTQQSAPAILGFGISTPDQVRGALAAGAAGVIVGSALVSRQRGVAAEQVPATLAQYVTELKQATRR